MASVSILLAGPGPAELPAQWYDARFPRRGEFQIGLGGSFTDVDSRFAPDGSSRPFSQVYARTIDSGFEPTLDPLNQTVQDLFADLGLTDPAPLTLGTLRFDVLMERTRVPLSVSWAATDWLAVSATVPIALGKAFVGGVVDAAGAGPAETAFGGNADAFFGGLAGAIAELESALAADTLSAVQQARAEELLADARAIESGLAGFRDLQLAPTDSGAAGSDLHDVYDGMTQGFAEFEIELPELALAEAIAADSLASYLSGPGFGIETPATRDSGIRFGDIEVGVSLQPINTFRARSDRAPRPVRFRTRLDAIWRFPSGRSPAANRIFDPGAGEGHADIDLRAVVDVAFGNRFWISAFGSYSLQRETEIERLFTLPEVPLQTASFVALVRWDPGDIWSIGAAPRYNLTETITLSGLLSYSHRGRDAIEPAGSLPANAPFGPTDLIRGTEYSTTGLGFGVRYSATGWDGSRSPKLPVEVELRYRRAIDARDGFAPEERTWQIGVRWYPG